jgi:hypothetical protein
MPPKMQQQIRTGVQTYLTPILLGVIGYLLNAKIEEVNSKLAAFEQANKTLIQVEQRVINLEFRVNQMQDNRHSQLPMRERLVFRHEDIFTLKNKKQWQQNLA